VLLITACATTLVVAFFCLRPPAKLQNRGEPTKVWMIRARCHKAMSISSTFAPVTAALKDCLRCPVQRQCLDYSVSNMSGIRVLPHPNLRETKQTTSEPK
jgi:hypothetical protein